MNDCKTIHETVVRDIVDTLVDFKKSDAIAIFNNPKSFRSASKATSNLILTFPILCSSNIPLDEMTMLMKSHERKCAVMMKMLFTAISVADNDNAIDYIRGLHNNMNMREDDIDIEYAMDALDQLASKEESANPRFNKEYYEAIREDMNNLKYGLETRYIKQTSLNEFRYYNYDGTWKSAILNEGSASIGGDFIQAGADKHISTHDTYFNGPGTYSHVTRTEKITMSDRSGKESNRARAMKDINDSIKNSFISTDFKKANELLPTMLIINFYEDGDSDKVLTAIIGIKAKVYPIDPQQIIERMVSKNSDNHGLFQFIRAATREISFWKDFVFALDKARLDANSSSHRGIDSSVWKLLERRALKSKIKMGLGMKNDASAITSLAITQDEADFLKKEYNLDVNKIGIIKPIMKAYNIMCFIIVNETLNSVKFLYDDDGNAYETYSFRSLERDSDNKDYKEIVNVMSKMAR